MAQESAEERRRRLVGIARDLIAEEGVSACTFRRLAAAGGTSTRPFTHAFGTRDALLRAVALSTWEDSPVDVHGEVAPADRPADWDCVEELAAIGSNWLPLTPEQTRSERVYLEIILFCLTRPDLRRELLGFSAAANRQLAAVVEEGQRRGQVRSDRSAHDLVMAFWSYHAGMALVAIYEPEELSDLAEVWRDGVRALLAA